MWHTVELRELRVFLVLAEELHFGRTAIRMGLTQSRVSQTLRDLERKLGLLLVSRTSRRVALTAAGVQFREDAGRALGNLEDVLQATQETGEQLQAPVRLGIVSPAQVVPTLQAAIAAHEAAHSTSYVQFVGLPFVDRFGPLMRGEVDVMVTSLPLSQSGISTGPVLARQPRLLAVGRAHPLAEKSDVSIEDVADYAVGEFDVSGPADLLQVITPLQTPTGRVIARAAPPLRDPVELLLAVAAGRIVQPVLATFVTTYRHPDVVYVPIRDLQPVCTVLAWRRGNRHPGLRQLLRATAASSRAPRLGAD